jgi:hypothetical protein
MAADILKNKNIIFNPKTINYQTSSLNISAMSDRELHKVFRKAYMRLYLNPKSILKIIMHHPNILALPRSFVTFLKILPNV